MHIDSLSLLYSLFCNQRKELLNNLQHITLKHYLVEVSFLDKLVYKGKVIYLMFYCLISNIQVLGQYSFHHYKLHDQTGNLGILLVQSF